MRNAPTNMDDTIDVRDLIARFEGLEEARKPWRAGWNMPGYMPDSEPAGFETFEDARDYIAEEMRRAIDEDATATEHWLAGKDAEDAAANHDALEEASKRWVDLDEGEHGETIGKYHYWIAQVSGADAFEDESEATEYEQLKSILEELCGNGGDEQWRGDWYPVTMVRDSYFEDHAQELAEDCGMVNRNATWPNNCIDWKQAARELQQDYSTVDFDGVTYWYR